MGESGTFVIEISDCHVTAETVAVDVCTVSLTLLFSGAFNVAVFLRGVVAVTLGLT